MTTEELKEELKLSKVCPKCNVHFAADFDGNCCPMDQSLLAPLSPSLLHTTINERYEVMSLLGSGASSEVFLAHNKRLNKVVALKILHLTLVSDPLKVARFQDEARAVTKLKHSSIASVHDFGLTQNGRPFMVMDFVDGDSLTEKITNEIIEEEEACKFLIQLCDALELAHGQGIIHRDIKPANILFEKSASGKTVAKLVDFGIARTIVDENHTDVTRTGEVLGTPAYMSPEQCMGQKVDGRSDIYSLGCVFFEMLNGERLVQAENAFDCMDWHLSKNMPTYTSPTTAARDIDYVLKKMLSKDPDMRYSGVEDLRNDLEKISQGIPLSIPKQKKNWNRHLAKAAGLSAAMAALLFLVFAVDWQSIIPNINTHKLTQPQAQLGALKDLRFWLTLHTNSKALDGAPVLVESNGFGPLSSGKVFQVPAGTVSATFAPELNSFFCATKDQLFQMNRDGSNLNEFLQARKEVELNGIESIAYDTKRHKFFVFGAGPGDHDCLSLYNPHASVGSHQNWAMLFTPPKVRKDVYRELRGISYDAETDRVYALAQPDDFHTSIYELSPAGQKLDTIPLNTVVPLALAGNQFFVSKGMAIIFVPADTRSTDYTAYVYDLSAGKLLQKRPMNWNN